MAITNISRTWATSPGIVNIISTDDLTTLTTAGYLASEEENINIINGGTFEFDPSDLILIYYAINQWSFFSRDPITGTLIQEIAGGAGDVTIQDIQRNSLLYAPDTGSANSYIVNISPNPNPLVQGAVIYTTIANTNNDTSSVTINGVFYNARNTDGSNLSGGELLAGQYAVFGFDGTNLQLLNPAIFNGGVTPADIQNQTYVYCVDTSVTPNSIVVAANPTIGSLVDGMKLSIKVANNSINGAGFTLTADGTGAQPILSVDGMTLLGNSFVANYDYEFTWNDLFGGWILTSNPAVGTEASAIAVQQGTWNTSNDTGLADAYAGTYLPSVSLTNTLRLYLTDILHTNLTSTPTFNAGLGTAVITLNNGSPVAPGDIPVGGSMEVVWSSPHWLLQNPAISNATTSQIVGTFNPGLLNYTATGGSGLVATGNYVQTGSNVYVNMAFSNPGGTLAIYNPNVTITNLPVLPSQIGTAELIAFTIDSLAFLPSTFQYNYSLGSNFGFGISGINQGGVDYIIYSDDAMVLHATELSQTSSAPFYQLTQTDSVSLTQTLLNSVTFQYGANYYVVGGDSGASTFPTTPINNGTFGTPFYTATTHPSLGGFALFVSGGTQYAVNVENSQYLETFSFNGTAWTSVDVFNTTHTNIGLPSVFELSGTIYLVLSDAVSGKIFTYSWTGTTWTTAVADLTLALNAWNAVNVYEGTAYLLTGFSAAANLNIYSLGGGVWNFVRTDALDGKVDNITTFVANGVSYYAIIEENGFAVIYGFDGTTVTGTAAYTFTGGTFAEPIQAAILPTGWGGYFFISADTENTINGIPFTEGGLPIAGGLVTTDGAIQTEGLNNAYSGISKFFVSATYQTVSAGIGVISSPATVQKFATILAPFSFSSGTNQVFIFDGVVGPTGLLNFNSGTGTFTVPSDIVYGWELQFQGYMPTNYVDNMRLHIVTPFSTDFSYMTPVQGSVAGAWCNFVFRGTIALGATFQLWFDSSATGTFDNGSGASNGLVTFMTARIL